MSLATMMGDGKQYQALEHVAVGARARSAQPVISGMLPLFPARVGSPTCSIAPVTAITASTSVSATDHTSYVISTVIAYLPHGRPQWRAPVYDTVAAISSWDGNRPVSSFE